MLSPAPPLAPLHAVVGRPPHAWPSPETGRYCDPVVQRAVQVSTAPAMEAHLITNTGAVDHSNVRSCSTCAVQSVLQSHMVPLQCKSLVSTVKQVHQQMHCCPPPPVPPSSLSAPVSSLTDCLSTTATWPSHLAICYSHLLSHLVFWYSCLALSPGFLLQPPGPLQRPRRLQGHGGRPAAHAGSAAGS